MVSLLNSAAYDACITAAAVSPIAVYLKNFSTIEKKIRPECQNRPDPENQLFGLAVHQLSDLVVDVRCHIQ